VGKTDRKLIVQSDNARPQIATKSFELSRAKWNRESSSSPYSPDLALCDFYFFGSVKHLLPRREFAERNELEQAVMAILDDIEKVSLREAFLTWMGRLTRCIETNRE
jgi:hypothetical protein